MCCVTVILAAQKVRPYVTKYATYRLQFGQCECAFAQPFGCALQIARRRPSVSHAKERRVGNSIPPFPFHTPRKSRRTKEKHIMYIMYFNFEKENKKKS